MARARHFGTPYVKEDRTGAFLVFKDVEEAKVKGLIPTLPMFKHFDRVEYSFVTTQF